jgi:hypothetical protein
MGGRLGRGCAAVMVVAALTLAPGGPPAAASGPRVAQRSSLAADRALAELVGGDGSPEGSVVALPRFREVMGYVPGRVRLAPDPAPRLIKPGGACSSPIGATWFDFDWPCKAHDLGYDLLRYADRTGVRLEGDARRRIDDRFALDLHNHCATTRTGLAKGVCETFGWIYAGVARLNSWRQRYGAP